MMSGASGWSAANSRISPHQSDLPESSLANQQHDLPHAFGGLLHRSLSIESSVSRPMSGVGLPGSTNSTRFFVTGASRTMRTIGIGFDSPRSELAQALCFEEQAAEHDRVFRRVDSTISSTPSRRPGPRKRRRSP
jgi:hypothetical protein